MKLFKGKMSLWKQLTSNRLMDGPGGLMDTSTYKATIGALYIGLFTYFIFWNGDAMTDDFRLWLRNPKLWFLSTTPWHLLKPAVRRHHFYAYVFLIFGLFVACLSFYSVWSSRRRARKSTQGQWYDKPDLTNEDLCGKGSDRRNEEDR